MSRRLEIEITSINGDVATWRAAGAKLPKGVLNISLVPGDARVGAVYRADVEQYMEGMEVLSVLPPKTASPLDPKNERLQILVKDSSGPDVTVTYASKGRGNRGERGDRGERGERRPRGDRPARTDRPGGERQGAERSGGARPTRGARPDRARPGARGERPAGPPLTTTHRNAFLATLSPEQLPVAEQLLRGGMPAVRAAVAEQNKNATAQGRPTVDPATIDRIAEDLLSKTNLAMWKDRAAGALGAGKELKLRDLRAVVTSAKTTNLDDDARAQLKELQTLLSARLDVLRTRWTNDLEQALAAKNWAETLRLAARPPDMSTRLSSEAASAIVAGVSEALNPGQSPSTFVELVELSAETSIRRNIKPVGIPSDEACRNVAVKYAGAIPEFAKLLGMKVPPPPPPTRRPSTRRAS